MLTRRDLFRGLAALPALGLVAPLARWLGGTTVVTRMRRATVWGAQAGRLAFEPPVGCHIEKLVFDDIEEEQTVSAPLPMSNPTVRVSVQGGPVLWEDKGQELLPWRPDGLVDRLLEKGSS